MRGHFSIVKFLLVLAGGTALGGLVLGLFGYLLAGKEGFIGNIEFITRENGVTDDNAHVLRQVDDRIAGDTFQNGR